jgi:uncharacterized protein YqeY
MKNDLELRLGEDLKRAMRAKDPITLDTIRSIRAAIQSRTLEAGAELAEADVLKLIRGLVKQREESIAQYNEGGRADLVERETAEKAILEGYLPDAPSAADVERVVGEVVVELQANSLKDMGKVMKAALERLGPAVDGKAVSTAVKTRLAP